MNLSDKEIKEELEKEDPTNYESTNNDQPVKNLSILAATNQESPTSDECNSDKIHQVISPDLENTNHDEPDQEDFPAIDQTTIDQPINPLDKEYRTQWVSLDPNKEQPHKIPKTPRNESP